MNLFLLMLISAASAAELSPIEAPAPTEIRTGTETGNYHLIRAGRQLDFDTLGPINLTVEVRQRLASTQQRAEGELKAVGDGVHAIMTITVRASAEKQGFTDDAYGGVPCKVDSAEISVPDGGKMLSLVAPAGGGDFLVRVMDEGGLDPAVIAPVATENEAEEPDEEPRVTVEECVDRPGRSDDCDNRQGKSHDGPQQGCRPDDRAASLASAAPTGHEAGGLLLQRQEESDAQEETQGPEHGDR